MPFDNKKKLKIGLFASLGLTALFVDRVRRRWGRAAALVVAVLSLGTQYTLAQVARFALGSMGLFGINPFRTHAEMHKRFGSIFLAPGGRIAVVSGERAAERVLGAKASGDFLREPGWPVTFKTLIGKSLFIREDGPEARRIRRTVVKALHGSSMRHYVTEMQRLAEIHLARLAAEDGEVGLHSAAKRYTFSVAATLLLGVRAVGVEDDEVERLEHHFSRLTAGFTSLPVDLGEWSGYGRALVSRDRIHEHLAEVLAKKRKSLLLLNPEESDASKPDALTNLLRSVDDETKRSLSEEELVTQTKLLLIAGYDSSSSFITASAE